MCPLCGLRKAKRSCPALGHSICTVCCGTKRIAEIRCPDSCIYLASSREHPPATTVRQQRSDVALLTQAMQDLNEQQARLFVGLCTLVAGYKPPELQRLTDEDVQEAAGALAATLETSSRGVIYEHAATSGAAQRLASEIRPLLNEALKGRGSSGERDAAMALRQFERLVEQTRMTLGARPRAFLDLLVRFIGHRVASAAPPESRLIVP